MTKLWNLLKNEPAVILTVALAVLQGIAQGLSPLTVAIVAVGIVLRFLVTPNSTVEVVRQDNFDAGVLRGKSAPQTVTEREGQQPPPQSPLKGGPPI